MSNDCSLQSAQQSILQEYCSWRLRITYQKEYASFTYTLLLLNVRIAMLYFISIHEYTDSSTSKDTFDRWYLCISLHPYPCATPLFINLLQHNFFSYTTNAISYLYILFSTHLVPVYPYLSFFHSLSLTLSLSLSVSLFLSLYLSLPFSLSLSSITLFFIA